MEQALGSLHSTLPWFVSAEDLDVLRTGKAAIDALDSSEAARGAIVRAYEIRARIIAEVRARDAEFVRVLDTHARQDEEV